MGATTSWSVWGLEASVTVSDPSALGRAEQLVREVVGQVDASCSRFRPDSEIRRLQANLSSGVKVSPMLAALMQGALDAAQLTAGDVDPTLGTDLEALGYDRDIKQVFLDPAGGELPPALAGCPRKQVWEQIELNGSRLTVPEDVRIDLGATAKAIAADFAAQLVFAEVGCGVLVSLGGDISTSGPAPVGGWQVLVQDLPEDPWQQVTLGAGQAMATSSTQKRRWKRHGLELHHILDPRFGMPVEPVWRSVTVAASSCLLANALSTAGIVRGFAAVSWFEREAVAGRLVDRQGRCVVSGGWPAESNVMMGECSRG